MWYWARDIEYETFPTRANDLVYQNNAKILIRNGGSVVSELEKNKTLANSLPKCHKVAPG